MSIHSRIKSRRLEMGYASHKALADAIGVSWQTVQLWEKEGGTAPNRSRIGKVAEVLKCTPDYLMYGNEGASAADFIAVQPDGSVMIAQVKQTKNAPQVEYIFATPEEIHLLSLYRRADDRGRDEVMSRLEALDKVIQLPTLVGGGSDKS